MGNAELNYLETDPTRITARPTHGSNPKGHICWFEEKWEWLSRKKVGIMHIGF